MYVWARLLRMAATARSRGPYRLGEAEAGRLRFRCLPTDIDTNLHLNNARYMMLADLGRIDIFMRSGFLALARRSGWAPMLGGLQTVFVREIRLWERFEVVSSVETWAGSQVLGRHVFVLPDGRVAATVLTTAGVYDRRGKRFLGVEEMVAQLGSSATPRPPSDVEQAFLDSHRRLRGFAKGE